MDDFVNLTQKFDYCATGISVEIKYNTITEKAKDCYVDNFIALGSTTLKINIYYSGKFQNDIKTFNNYTYQYRKTAILGKGIDEINKKFYVARDVLIKDMTDNLQHGLSWK